VRRLFLVREVDEKHFIFGGTPYYPIKVLCMNSGLKKGTHTLVCEVLFLIRITVFVTGLIDIRICSGKA
jgi:hypothetical protein